MADGLLEGKVENIANDKLKVMKIDEKCVKIDSLEEKFARMKEMDEKSMIESANKNGGKNVLNENTNGLNNKLDKDIQTSEDNGLDDERKKRRCADRYDSSESSDSGIATLSCTDSSTASSDSASDPCSPYSSSSTCEDSQNSNKSKSLSSSLAAAVSATTSSTVNSDTSKMAPHIQAANLTLKQQHQPHQWPWNNAANKLKRSQNNTAQPQSDKSNNVNGIKRIRSSSTDKTSITANSNKKLPQMAIVSATNVNQNAITSKVGKTVKNAATTTNDVTNANKITGYFKSQIKTTNMMNNLKTKINKTLATIASTTTISTAVSVTEIQTATVPTAIPKAKPLTMPTLAKNGSIEMYMKLLQQQELVKNVNKSELDVRTLTTTVTPSMKKVERKTARIAPTPSLPRKVNNTQGALSVGQPKKPVTIAPRAIEPKITNPPSTVNSNHKMVQQQQQQPTVLLTTIRIPQQQQQNQTFKQNPMTQQVSSPSRTPTKNVGSTLYQFHQQTAVMPNLVQIPNLVPTQVTPKVTASQAATTTANLLMNTARINNGTAQLLMNGAVIKLQQIQNQQQNITVDQMNLSNLLAKQTSITTVHLPSTTNEHNVPFTTTTTLSNHQQNKTFTIHPQQQFAHQQFAPQQFIMTPNGLLLNAMPTMLTGIPALHPLQPNQPQNNNAGMLPNIAQLLQNQQLLANFNLQASKIPQPHQAYSHQSTMVPISSQLFLAPSQPPALLNTLATPLTISTTTPALTTSIPASQLSPPPLVATNLNPPKLIIASQPSSIPCSSSSTTITPPTIASTQISEPPKLVPVQPLSPAKLIKPVVAIPKTQMKIAVTNVLTLDCGSSTDSGVALSNKSEKDREPVVDLCSPTIPVLSPKLKPTPMQCQFSPKSLVLEKIKQKKPSEMVVEEAEVKTIPVHQSTPIKSVPSIDTEFHTASLPECAKSPILSQPKTIRFPALNGTHYRFGRNGFRKSADGRLYGQCYWKECSEKFDTSSKLLTHLQMHHVNTQSGPFSCQWDGCKVHNKESCSRRWLERHVCSHVGKKPFPCIVAGCGLRFGSQLALEKHVNNHFNNSENSSSSKRSSDPPAPKVLKNKINKKLKYRLTPWSARRFDFFDSGIMEGLKHCLNKSSHFISGPKGTVCFKGTQFGKRVTSEGVEILVKWSPSDIISDDWMLEKDVTREKRMSIHEMSREERHELENYLRHKHRISSKRMIKEIHEINDAEDKEKLTFNSRTSPKKLRKPVKAT